MANKHANPPEGKRFTSDYQPLKRGARKTTARTFLEAVKIDMPDMVLTKADYYRILNMIIGADKSYIQELAQREDIPVSMLCIIKAIKTDIDEGSTKTVDSLLDRLFGKSNQPITGAEGRPLIPEMKMTREEIEAEIKRLQQGE